MKTKTRTIIEIAAIGLIGFFNINAATDNKREALMNVVAEKEESLTIESWMLENPIWNTKTPAEAETPETEKALEVEAWMLDEKIWN